MKLNLDKIEFLVFDNKKDAKNELHVDGQVINEKKRKKTIRCKY